MAQAGTIAHAIPDFGPVVRRVHILNTAKAGSPALTVVCAPVGYGKSVLAAQLAQDVQAQYTIWVRLYDTDVSGDDWLSRVLEGLPVSSPVHPDDKALSVTLRGDSSRVQLLLEIRERLEALAGSEIVVVLDGANRVESLAPFIELAQLVRSVGASRSEVILTCRAVSTTAARPEPADVWCVCDQDLLFDEDEVRELVSLSRRSEQEIVSEASHLLSRCSGHPALTAIMVRHARFDDDASPPRDLIWYTQRLVSSLSAEAAPWLYAAALLREGSIGELEAALDDIQPIADGLEVMQPVVPLLQVGKDHDGRFRMHAVLCDEVLRTVPKQLGDAMARTLRASARSVLLSSGDYPRLQRALVSDPDSDAVVRVCEDHGPALLASCGAAAVEQCLRKVPASRLSASPRLLLLRAATLRERERIDEALTHTILAHRIAEVDGDLATQVDAALATVHLAVYATDLRRAREALGQLQASLYPHMDEAARCLCESIGAVLAAESTDWDEAVARFKCASEALVRLDKSRVESVWSGNSLAGVQGQMFGRWDLVQSLLVSMQTWPALTALQRLLVHSNLWVSRLEIGYCEGIEESLRALIAQAEDAGLSHIAGCAMSTLADACWESSPDSAADFHCSSAQLLVDVGELAGFAAGLVTRAMIRRAEHRAEEALASAESAIAMLHESGDSMRLLRLSAEIEVAASMLALGDRWGARRVATRLESELHDTPAKQHLLLVSAVLSELDRLDGDRESAADWIRPYVDYIATGSANWRLALYIRAFPGLLATLVSLMGAAEIPLRMIRLIPEEVIDSAVANSGGSIGEADRQVLLARIRGSESPVVVAAARPEAPPCRVRLFGGFEVAVNGQRIEDVYWRKRKVRLLFAMLAAQRGRDMPRDVILERLWPGMDEERARRNFYVTWSAMKRALGSAASGETTGPYAVCTSGVCRVTAAVSSDLDDFQEAVAAIRAANSAARPEDVLAAARRLLETYRGDFLPGDVYEEWFADLREQAKHDFCDAMLLGAQAAEALGDPGEALIFLRRAGSVDPWREDIYQAMMRCQIGTGQRSRAIETYMTCRDRLVDDLGIDPSAETTRLYQAVLAMDSDTAEEFDSV